MGNPSTNIGHFVTKRALLDPDLEASSTSTPGAASPSPSSTPAQPHRAPARRPGVGRGDRVALLLMNTLEFMESYFAIAKLGAIACPSTGGSCPTSWRSSSMTPAPRRSCSAASSRRGRDLARPRRRRPRSRRSSRSATASRGLGDGLRGRPGARRPTPSRRRDATTTTCCTSCTRRARRGCRRARCTPTPRRSGRAHHRRHGRPHFGDRYLVSLPLFHVGALTPAAAALYAGVTRS